MPSLIPNVIWSFFSYWVLEPKRKFSWSETNALLVVSSSHHWKDELLACELDTTCVVVAHGK